MLFFFPLQFVLIKEEEEKREPLSCAIQLNNNGATVLGIDRSSPTVIPRLSVPPHLSPNRNRILLIARYE